MSHTSWGRWVCGAMAVALLGSWWVVYRGVTPFDLAIYLEAGAMVRAGRSPLAAEGWLYPPLPLLLYALPPAVATWGHWLLTFAAGWAVAWEGAARAGKWWPLVALAVLVASPLAHAVSTGNLSLIVAGMVVLGLRARRPWLAGVLLGAAAASKLLPAVVLFAWWRSPNRWRVWGWATVVGSGSLLLPGGREWLAAGGPLVAMEYAPQLAHKVWALPPVARPVAGVLAVGLCALGPAWAPLGLAVAPWATALPWAHTACVALAGWPTWEPASTGRRELPQVRHS